MNFIKKHWQNYVEQYPYKWQWWVSGLVYGFYVGKWFEKTKRVHEMWNPAVYEYLTWWDAFKLAIDMELLMDLDFNEITIWLLEHGYTFPITTDSRHTAFCSSMQCYCPDKSTSRIGDHNA